MTLTIKNLIIRLFYIIVTALAAMTIVSCSKDGPNPPLKPSVPNHEHTLMIFMSWSNNLLPFFNDNLDEIQSSLTPELLSRNRVVAFLAQSGTQADIFEFYTDPIDNAIKRKTLKSYSGKSLSTSNDIAEILTYMKEVCPASRYSLLIGCHGMGWLPVRRQANQKLRQSGMQQLFHWDITTGPLTRYFGGTSAAYQFDITDLATAIEKCGVKMDYILFDDCYMANVEVAYDLQHVTNYLIASTCEIMARGMPYVQITRHLLDEPDYKSIVNEFTTFYTQYVYPYGTISVIDCSKIENLTNAMKEVNSLFSFNEASIGKIQALDGYKNQGGNIFFDLGSYVDNMAEGVSLSQQQANALTAFKKALQEAVPYYGHTEQYYSAFDFTHWINAFCGMTVSDPTANPLVVNLKRETDWWRATH